MPRAKDLFRPLCWGCRRRVARHPGEYPVFCGERCAIAFAYVMASKVAWCGLHQVWHQADEPCQECRLLRMIPRGGHD